jgi:hypothetical protein
MNDTQLNDNQSDKPSRRMSRKTKLTLAIIGAGVLVLGGGGLIVAQAAQGVHNAGVSLQERLIRDKNNIGIALSNCTQKSTVGTEVAIMQSDKVKDILTGALAARYQTPQGSTPNPKTQALPNNGSLISALSESYPNVDVSTWKQLLVIVASCNDDTTDAQKLLQGDAEQLAAWTQQGNVFSSGWHAKFPNSNLYFFDANGNRLTGQAALEAMRNPVLLGSARDANGSGTQQQQNLPGFSPTPAATASR